MTASSMTSPSVSLPSTPFALRLINQIIVWVVVPCILLLLFTVSYVLGVESRAIDEEDRVSRLMGFFLGLAVFVMLVILNLTTNLLIPVQGLDAFARPLQFIITALVAGFATIAAIHLLSATRAGSVIVSILASTSLSALYFYFLTDELRSGILLSAVSFLVGALFYAVLFPGVFKRVGLL